MVGSSSEHPMGFTVRCHSPAVGLAGPREPQGTFVEVVSRQLGAFALGKQPWYLVFSEESLLVTAGTYPSQEKGNRRNKITRSQHVSFAE